MNAPDFSKVPLTLDQWTKREIQPRDRLLGDLLSTTSRAILSADTGLGKTNFSLALAFHMSAGRDFCHWKAHRPARILFIDGEMPRELMQERLSDAERRLGERPKSLFCLSREDVEDMPPLDVADRDGNMIGQQYIEHLIAYLGWIDFIIFDNLGCLTVGDLANPESWLPMVPYMRHLSKQRIGQLWINHTGHDKSRDYGPRMRLWQMDVAMVATRIEGHYADIAFKLEFVKARQRKPSNRADFEPVNLILDQDQWTTSAAKPKKGGYGKNQKIVLEAADYVLTTAGKPSSGLNGLPTLAIVASREQLQNHCIQKMHQKTERRRKAAFDEAFESLSGPAGPLGVHRDYFWLTNGGPHA